MDRLAREGALVYAGLDRDGCIARSSRAAPTTWLDPHRRMVMENSARGGRRRAGSVALKYVGPPPRIHRLLDVLHRRPLRLRLRDEQRASGGGTSAGPPGDYGPRGTSCTLRFSASKPSPAALLHTCP